MASIRGEVIVRALSQRAVLAAISAMATLWILLPPGAAAAVPANGRAWELVTPAEPISGRIVGSAQPSRSGEEVNYASLGPVPGAPSGSFLSLTAAQRGPGGWTGTPLGFPYPTNSTELFYYLPPMAPIGAADGRLTSLWISVVPLTPDGPPEGIGGLYRRQPDSTPKLVARLGEISVVAFYGEFTEESVEGEHAVFSTKEHLLPSDAGRTEGASIYDSVGTSLEQVDVDDDGSLLSSCGSDISHSHGVSDDGERIFFTNPDPETCSGTAEVYVREGGAETTEVSASQCTRPDCDSPQDVAFAGATPDGEVVFMTSTQQLTNDDLDSASDLYRYDMSDGKMTLLSGGTSTEGYVLSSTVRTSADGSYVYFYVGGSLNTGDGAGGISLYLVGPHGLRFVATGMFPPGFREIEESVQLAQGGRLAMFDSAAKGEAGDTDESSDVYLYDAGSEALSRLSQGPIGGNGPFPATSQSSLEKTADLGSPLTFRALSQNGDDAFFTTAEKLVPEDTNGVVDLYEWREGQVGLVSSGTGEGKAIFAGATLDGRTAFLNTSEALVPADRDGGDRDLYAARVGGGFAAAESAPVGCGGGACQPRPAPSARVARPVPASAADRRAAEGKGRLRLLEIREDGSGGVDAGPRPTLFVAVPAPGRVSAVVTELGRDPRVLARGGAGAARPGKVRIPLRLTDLGARVMARHDPLQGRLTIRQGGRRLVRTISLGQGGRR
jgi:hypothetical protein